MGFMYGVTLSRVGERQKKTHGKSEVGHNDVHGPKRTNISPAYALGAEALPRRRQEATAVKPWDSRFF